MVSEDMDLVPQQRMENGLNSQLVFQDESLQFNCGAPQGGSQRRLGDPGRKSREVTNFVDEKMFSVGRDRYFGTPSGGEFRRNIYDNSSSGRQDRTENQNWNGNGGSTETPSGEGSEGDDEDEDDDDEEEEDEEDEVDEGDGEVEGLVAVEDGNKNNNNSSGSVHSMSDKVPNQKENLQKQHPSFGPSRGVLVKDGNVVHSVNNLRGSSSEQQQQQQQQQQGRGDSHYENAVTIAEPDMYYSHFLQGQDGSAVLGQKEIGGENGCGFSGRRDVSLSMESGESLRKILSDPVTGTLMDDANILPCGHSFGSGGIQHVIRMKACHSCQQSVSEDMVAPNLSLRSAVQAFRREEELQSYRVSKRKRERFEQDNSNYGHSFSMDLSRGKGVQFPFAVTDRVIIKGNKRTPLRFVGREAVVTTQCLNGWYVVKTLDNAESVKLQYRSLAKVSDSPSSNNIISRQTTPNWH